jgi:hypothetical protein
VNVLKTLRIRGLGDLSFNRLAFVGSIAGFQEPFVILFPICGYVGFSAMIGISLHFFSLERKIGMKGIGN